MAQFTRSEATYLVCPRCSLMVLKGSDEDGSPLCPDCGGADDVVVKMDLVTVPTSRRGSTSDE